MLKSKLKDLFNHTGFMRYLRNMSWLVGGQMVRMLLGLLVSVAVARHLGPADFGLFNLVLSIVALVSVGATLGMENVAKREFVKDPDQAVQLLGTCVVLSSVASLVLFACLLGASVLSSVDSFIIIICSLLGASILLAPLRFIDVWFQSQTRGDLSVLSSFGVIVGFAVLKLIALVMNATLLVFCVLYLLEICCIALVQIGLYQRHFKSVSAWRFSLKLAKRMLAESWPLIFSALAVTIYMHIDQVMLGFFKGNHSVGEYAAATKISSILNFIPVMLGASLFPAIVNAKKLGRDIYHQRLQNYFDLSSGLAYAVVLPVSLLAPWVVDLLYGEQYARAGVILSIHAWAALFVFTGVARSQYLVTEGLLKFSLLATSLGALINVSLNCILIPQYAGVGAAIATVLSYSVAAYLTSLMFQRTRSVFVMQTRALFLIINPVRLFR